MSKSHESNEKAGGGSDHRLVLGSSEFPERIEETWRADAGWQRADEAEAKLEEMREALDDPARVHASILSGAIKLTQEQALHIGGYYADGFQKDAEPQLLAECLEVLENVYDSTVDASSYPDGENLSWQVRQRIKAILEQAKSWKQR
jgi:hypothetical protein